MFNVTRYEIKYYILYTKQAPTQKYIIFPYFHKHHNKRRPTPQQQMPTWVAGPPHPQKVDKIKTLLIVL